MIDFIILGVSSFILGFQVRSFFIHKSKNHDIKNVRHMENGKNVMIDKNYLYIDHIDNPREYVYWYNPPNVIYKDKPPRDWSNSTLKFKEFKNKVEIYAVNFDLSNSRGAKFTLNLNLNNK